MDWRILDVCQNTKQKWSNIIYEIQSLDVYLCSQYVKMLVKGLKIIIIYASNLDQIHKAIFYNNRHQPVYQT